VGECVSFAPYICDENNELSCGAVAKECLNQKTYFKE